MKVFIEDSDAGVTRLFAKKGFTISEDEDDADIIVFTGGADVSPHLYGEVKLDCSSIDYPRDIKCGELYKKFEGKPKIGICRGAQFLNVMNGGKMYQDVYQHTKNHVIFTAKGENLGEVTSTHHQMMIPSAAGIVLAVAEESLRRRRAAGTVIGSFRDDTEVVRYAATESFCFQPHPEYGHRNTERLFWLGLSKTGPTPLVQFLKEREAN